MKDFITFPILLIETAKLLVAVGGLVFAIVFSKRYLKKQSSPSRGANDAGRTTSDGNAFLLNFSQRLLKLGI